MRFKSGVKINGLKTETLAAMIVADKIVWEETGTDLVITSVCDGKHSPASLHYVGYGFDFRTRYTIKKLFTPLQKRNIKKKLQERLTREFDVVLEKDHFHIEFQPKR